MTVENLANDNILNIFKPKGWSSFDVVRKVRNVTRIRKIGHAGTLDPFATGVLLLALGKACKQITTLQDLSKEYVGEIELGLVTDTLDPTGEITQTNSFADVTEKAIQALKKEFTGEIEQVPPAFSAIKINGVRAYQLARKGKPVELKSRKVHIHSFEILKIDLPIIKIKIECSKGTYIRSLARDVGEKLGTGGILRSLERTRIGDYLVEDSLTIDELIQQVKNRKLFKPE